MHMHSKMVPFTDSDVITNLRMHIAQAYTHSSATASNILEIEKNNNHNEEVGNEKKEHNIKSNKKQ